MFFMSLSLPDVLSVIFLSGCFQHAVSCLRAEVQTKGNTCCRCGDTGDTVQTDLSEKKQERFQLLLLLALFLKHELRDKNPFIIRNVLRCKPGPEVPVVPAVET